MDIAIIPAYNPDFRLIELVGELKTRGIQDIIVVNDGSNNETVAIFKQLITLATILTHAVNQGKGQAIKTALSYVYNHRQPNCGIVLMDADGQHRPEDACRLFETLHTTKSGLILGVRTFGKETPIRSYLGNVITRLVFRLASGVFVSDTQTGLRAFSCDMIPKLLEVNGSRYEYEMNVLLACAKEKIPIIEVNTATIYVDKKNSSSHFHVIRDSVRIYGNILAFVSTSFLSFIVDYLLFFPMVWIFSFGVEAPIALIYGNIAARVISASFNYYLNRNYVFQKRHNQMKSLLRYTLLACVILSMNTILLAWLDKVTPMPNGVAKLVTEIALFLISYVVQRFFVF